LRQCTHGKANSGAPVLRVAELANFFTRRDDFLTKGTEKRAGRQLPPNARDADWTPPAINLAEDHARREIEDAHCRLWDAPSGDALD